MLRIVVFVLVAANVLYFGWSHWAAPQKPVLTALATAGNGAKKPLAPPPCATLGPFHDELMAEQAEKQLTKAGLRMQRRATSEDINDGWWVYVPNRDAAAQTRTLKAIRGAGLRDAFSMADDPEFRVSVGLFSEEPRAEDRAMRIQKLKLDAVVKERRKQQVTVWFDLPGIARETLGDGRLASSGLPLDMLRIEACPQPAESRPKTEEPAPTEENGAPTARTGVAAVTGAKPTRAART